MDLAIMIEPQEGLTYGDIRRAAASARSLSFSAFYRSDHYTSTLGRRESAATDAWTTIAGLTMDVQGIALGTLVSPVTFRSAPVLAKIASTAAEMAGAGPDGQTRIHVGLGTGWYRPEHDEYGLDLQPDVSGRFAKLEEHLRGLNMLWRSSGEACYLDGTHVRLRGAVFRPIPQPKPYLIVGGKGVVRPPALAAQYADELNALLLTVDGLKLQHGALRRACEEVGRDPSTVKHSALCGYVIGSTDRELEDRIARAHSFLRDQRSLAEFGLHVRDNWIYGKPDDFAERIQELQSSGVGKIIFHHLLYDDDDALGLIADEVVPRLG